ncbi:MAG: sulfotransferase family protein [Aureispira sp.]
MKPIDMMLVGAQKAGTTSLHNYLAEHPSITSHPQKEFTYFQEEALFQKGYQAIFDTYFKDNQDNKLIAKSATLANHSKGLERLAQHSPNCHLVLLVRNPVERAYSSYTMEQGNGWVEEPFDNLQSIIEQDNQQHLFYRLFIELGLYQQQLEKMLTYFPAEQIHIFLFKDLCKDPKQICATLFEQLAISPDFDPQTERVHNRTGKVRSQRVAKALLNLRQGNNPLKRLAKAFLPTAFYHKLGHKVMQTNTTTERHEAMSPALYQFLHHYFQPHNKAFQAATKLDLAHWEPIPPSDDLT